MTEGMAPIPCYMKSAIYIAFKEFSFIMKNIIFINDFKKKYNLIYLQLLKVEITLKYQFFLFCHNYMNHA
jgi:hypothetical protein